MSDFGANIFGPDDPVVPPRRPHKESPAPTAPAPAREPVREPVREARPPVLAEREREPAPRERERGPDRERAPREPRERPPEPFRGERRPDAPRDRRDERPRPDHPPMAREPRPHADRGPRRDGPRGEPGLPSPDGRHRDPHHQRPDRDRPAPARPEPQPPVELRGPAPARAAAAAPGRVALLVDFAALREEARAQGGELSQNKLRNGIANHRPVVRAVGFAAAGTPAVSGFEAMPADAGFAGGVQFAATAFELLAAAGHLVLAPATPAAVQLAQALQKAGHSVELAGLAAPGAGEPPVRRLGRDCMFVP